jgi:hypothetical protein
VRGLKNSEIVRAAALTYCVRRTGSGAFVKFCFKTPEHAQVFAERPGGERLPVNPRR